MSPELARFSRRQLLFNPGLPFTESKEQPSPIVIHPGDTLSTLANFYGFTQQEIHNLNPRLTDPNYLKTGDHLFFPPTLDLDLPLKKFTLDYFHRDISHLETRDDQSGVWMDPNFPYVIFGHSSPDAETGPFDCLHQVAPGQKVFFSRTLAGESGHWIESTVSQTITIQTTAEETSLLLLTANSHQILLVTCVADTANPQDRLILVCPINHYFCQTP